MMDKEGENEIVCLGVVFLREIKQIRLSYLIHSLMMDENVDFSVLHVDTIWDFGGFCCENAVVILCSETRLELGREETIQSQRK